jgi:tetratricopeptide (TPR) repeat protein
MKQTVLPLTYTGLALLAVFAFGILSLIKTPRIDLQALGTANRLYGMGHYAEATAIYEQLIHQSGGGSALYYNLGNSYYQQGDLGRAILNYERAAQMAPRDRDIQTNLDLARSQVVDAYPTVPVGPFDSLVKITSGWLTLNETAILALFLWFSLIFLILVRRQLLASKLKSSIRFTAFILLLFFIVIGLSLGSRSMGEYNQTKSIIVAPSVTVSSAPSERHPAGFQLHSGTEVKLLEADGDWIRSSAYDDVVEGWLPAKAVEPIAPSSPTSIF